MSGIDRTESVPEPAEVRGSEAGAWAFVWVVWGLMTLTAVVFVARFASDVPLWDDYAVMPAVVGAEPISVGWLWEQCNEHRIPLPKLILIGACRLAGNDVRAGMALSVVLLSGLAAALVALAGRLRGGPRASDAVFPVLLLHPGHASNLLWSIQVIHVLPTAVGTAFLLPIAGRPSWPGVATALSGGVGLVVLSLCGGTGLLYVPALALWLLAAAGAMARSGTSRSGLRALIMGASTVPGLALAALYFRGFRKGSNPPAPGGVLDALRTAVQFLTGGTGVPASWGWPWSGAVTAGLVALALFFLGRAWIFQPDDRPRVFGLVAFLAAILAIAAGVGWGRGWAGPLAGFQPRYVTMAAPLWCWFVVVFRRLAPPALGGFLTNALFAASCVLLWPNGEVGLVHGRGGAEGVGALVRDIRAGSPPYRIAARHTPFLHPSQDFFYGILPLLHRSGIGPFRELREGKPLREVPLPTAPTGLTLARWEAATSTAHVTGVDSQLAYSLPAPRFVAGVRLRYSHTNGVGLPARFVLTWKRPGQSDYVEAQRFANWTLTSGEHRQTTVWVDDVVDSFRVQPDNRKCDFRVEEIVLLEP